MVRIRKRSLAASSSGKQELPESCNGVLQPYAGPKSNPSFQNPKSSSFLSPPSIVKQDHSLLADCRYGQRPAPKQVPADAAAAVKSKPYSVLSSVCEVKPEKNDEGLIVMTREGDSRAMMDHAQEFKVKHMHTLDGADDDSAQCMDITAVSKVAGLASASASYTRKEVGRGDIAEERMKKARHIDAPDCITQHPCSNPAMIADATDYPRKVLPLQIILMSSESRHSTAAKVPAHNINSNNDKNFTSTGSTVSTPLKPKDTTRVQEKKVSPTQRKARALPPSSGGSFKHDLPEFAGKSIKLTRDEDANRCSQNSSDETLERQVSNWQGQRMARSLLQGGRDLDGLHGAPDPVASSVRPRVYAQTQQNINALVMGKENQIIKLSPEQKMLDSTPHNNGNFLSLHTLQPSSSAVLLFNSELKKQESSSTRKREAVVKRDHSLPAVVQVLHIPEELIGSVIGKPKVGAKKRKRAVIITDDNPEKTTMNAVPVSHVALACAETHDLWQVDPMRCRRKDGRRWRCKEQVVKPGAPFCHYHTLKMREKHGASVIGRLSKQPHGEAESSNHAESSRSEKIKKARKRRRVGSWSNCMAMKGGYGAGMNRYPQEVGEEEEEEEEEDKQEKEGHPVHTKLGKQQVKAQEAAGLTTVKRRWRKKCKPCIRRLHDIHDRARPAATDGLDFRKSFWEDTSYANNESPGTTLVSSLPECLLNTDPNEWRSDFP